MQIARSIGWDSISAVLILLILPAQLIAFALWALAIGATAVYGDWKVMIRLDLHLEVLGRCHHALGKFLLRSLALLVIVTVLSIIPLLNLVAPAYALIVFGHLIGLFFRQENEVLSVIYGAA